MIRTVALCASLAFTPLAACNTIPQSPFEQSLKDEKALYVAEAAYHGVATAALAAKDSGLLEGERSVQVADALQRAYDALLIARAAYAAGNLIGGQNAASEVFSAVSQAQSLIGL